ncbi:hypothetical protein BJX96DRAFT_160553 [Aspergillus floccosus]
MSRATLWSLRWQYLQVTNYRRMMECSLSFVQSIRHPTLRSGLGIYPPVPIFHSMLLLLLLLLLLPPQVTWDPCRSSCLTRTSATDNHFGELRRWGPHRPNHVSWRAQCPARA